MIRECSHRRKILTFGLTAKPCPVNLSSDDFTQLGMRSLSLGPCSFVLSKCYSLDAYV